MIITIANPIYDAVFKYLVEDERIARILLSALLKKEVVEVQHRRHEYTNGQRDKISMFRIDFGAKIREEDGSEHLVLIELQKTWLDTETLRFRQYLGAQYSNPENVLKEGTNKGYAIPTVAIYLLGHRVGDIDEPVLYVNHKSYDYDGVEVTKGLPDPFVESLTHNSIIVQIPLLRPDIKNRLDRVLSVFDQSRRDRHNHQVLTIDESLYGDDDEMRYILHRLLSAASNAQLRQDMNVEDEYFSAIEDRDTAIMNREKKIKELDAAITQQNEQLAQQGEQLAQQGEQLAQQGEQLAQQGEQLAQQGEQLAQQGEQLAMKDNQLAAKDRQLKQMVQGLQASGISLEQIAQMVGADIHELKNLL